MIERKIGNLFKQKQYYSGIIIFFDGSASISNNKKKISNAFAVLINVCECVRWITESYIFSLLIREKCKMSQIYGKYHTAPEEIFDYFLQRQKFSKY